MGPGGVVGQAELRLLKIDLAAQEPASLLELERHLVAVTRQKRIVPAVAGEGQLHTGGVGVGQIRLVGGQRVVGGAHPQKGVARRHVHAEAVPRHQGREGGPVFLVQKRALMAVEAKSFAVPSIAVPNSSGTT